MKFAQWLQINMDEADINQTRLADAIKEHQPTIQRILTGQTLNPRLKIIRKLENFFNNKYEGVDTKKGLPVVGSAQLGDDGFFVEMDYPVGHGDGYIDYPSKDDHAYSMRCKGESMRPRIKNGEFVIIEPSRPCISGDEVLVKCIKGRVMVKELLYIRDGMVYLGSINESYPKIIIAENEINIIHYVAGIVKKSLWHE